MNRLRFEKSPYLLQHQNNPVNWYAWSDEAFKTAKELNLPIFLSIGYSTCYWCHVMEKECFEDTEVAEVLNRGFLSIKLDREERPDVDQIYMDAVVGITGHGGWPMSVFLTHDLKPFFGGTYFPKQQFIPLLQKISEVWQKDRQSLENSAVQLFTFISVKSAQESVEATTKELFHSAKEYFSISYDEDYGGFGNAPKFPQASHLGFLLRLARRTNDDAVQKMASNTLQALCRGGIYDQLGGGFHRYSVDRAWLVPHFEKMLYDNAQLASVLFSAYQLEKKELFLNSALNTLDYCISIFQQEEGGFSAAEDAGDVGTEGEFYVWNFKEVEDLLGAKKFMKFASAYGITPHGNFENESNILSFRARFEEFSEFEEERKFLLEKRNERHRPFKDLKVITGWNGLIISALSQVSQIADGEKYLSAAIRAADFILEKLLVNQELKRRYCDKESNFDGVLEDYSFLIEGLINLFQASNEIRYYNSALALQSIQDELFWDSENGGYFFSRVGRSDIITRKKDYNDGATPSGNSVSALNLLKLYQLSGESRYLERFKKLKSAMLPHVAKYPGAYTTFLSALDYELEKQNAVIVSGDANAVTKAKNEFGRIYLPNTPVYTAHENGPLLIKKEKKSALGIFICNESGCSLPLDKLEDATLQLKPTLL